METINVRNTYCIAPIPVIDQTARAELSSPYSHFFRTLLYVVLTIPLPMGSDDVTLHR